MRIAQLQLHTYVDQSKTIEELKKKFKIASESKPNLICVGEMFACPYATDMFKQYSEREGGRIWQICSELAKYYGVLFSAGTIPEATYDGQLFNTAYVFGRHGEQIAKYRKMHLFDIDISGKQIFKESNTLSFGKKIMVFDTEYGRIGLCICFDLRFPEQASEMVKQGAKIIICPAAFNTTTGPLHWELLFRARAVDNQCFYIGTSNAQVDQFLYHSYGHSLVVSPWGIVLKQMGIQEGIQITDINLDEVQEVRKAIPVF